MNKSKVSECTLAVPKSNTNKTYVVGIDIILGLTLAHHIISPPIERSEGGSTVVMNSKRTTPAPAGLVTGGEGILPVDAHLVVEAHKSLVPSGGNNGGGRDGAVVSSKPRGREVLAPGDAGVKRPQLGVVHIHLVSSQAMRISTAGAVLGGRRGGVFEEINKGGGDKGGAREPADAVRDAVPGGADLVRAVKG